MLLENYLKLYMEIGRKLFKGDLMEKMKRSEKHRKFKDCGIPRYMMLDEKEKKRENLMFLIISLLMLVLALVGKNEIHRTFGTVALFISSLIGVMNR